jgi:hypothetical protein
MYVRRGDASERDYLSESRRLVSTHYKPLSLILKGKSRVSLAINKLYL